MSGLYIVVKWNIFFQAEDGIRDIGVTGVQTCALPISARGVPPGTARQLPALGRGVRGGLRDLRPRDGAPAARRERGAGPAAGAPGSRTDAPRSEGGGGGEGGGSAGAPPRLKNTEQERA